MSRSKRGLLAGVVSIAGSVMLTAGQFPPKSPSANRAPAAPPSLAATVERAISADPTVDNWALDRLDGAIDGRFVAAGDGAGVHIYIIDSGVRASHREFAGRLRVVGAFTDAAAGDAGKAAALPSPASSSPVNDDVSDCETGFDGHGTHVASYAAGARFGVAGAATVHVAKVSGGSRCEGSPVAAQRAIERIVATEPRGVINVSFAWPGVPEVRGLVASIRRAMDAGFVMTLSAACTSDVARTWLEAATETPQRALIVAATDRQDRSVQAPYAPLDYGRALTMFAPGNQVLGASGAADAGATPQPPLGRMRCSDSFAAPHAAGVAALYLQRHPHATPRDVHDALVAGALTGAVTGPLGSAANRLLRIVD